ncbi:MAG: hypothetical protein JXA72_06115 [Bacteroidales bacterium]|nr:hypothetical protein [Bacteroidales bacterium]
MKSKTILCVALAAILLACKTNAPEGFAGKKAFNKEKDLLLVQFDCKTDVDDIHTMASLATLMADSSYSTVKFHVVTGTYGTQEGLYVPPNDLLELAFKNNWTDAHENFTQAVHQIKDLVIKTLKNQGDIWIADAGQSDFSAELVKAVQETHPEIDIHNRIHIVQHSSWNEEVTSPDRLQYVKEHTEYQKIPDGNVVGNGTPGFRSPDFNRWKEEITDPGLIEIWQLAINTANKYNGKEGRYNNEAIAAGGLDFSDLSEVCWILGLYDIRNTDQFFGIFSK